MENEMDGKPFIDEPGFEIMTTKRLQYQENLKRLLSEAVYYLKVRCDVPEELIREIDKEIEIETKE